MKITLLATSLVLGLSGISAGFGKSNDVEAKELIAKFESVDDEEKNIAITIKKEKRQGFTVIVGRLTGDYEGTFSCVSSGRNVNFSTLWTCESVEDDANFRIIRGYGNYLLRYDDGSGEIEGFRLRF